MWYVSEKFRYFYFTKNKINSILFYLICLGRVALNKNKSKSPVTAIDGNHNLSASSSYDSHNNYIVKFQRERK